MSNAFEDTVVAVRQEAEYAAALMCWVLQIVASQQPVGGGETRLSLALALESAAALRLNDWEMKHLHIGADQGVPSAAEALSALSMRGKSGVPSAKTGLSLPERVFCTWLRTFAHHAREELCADVTVAGVDCHKLSDKELEHVADFLWAHRHAGRTQDRAGGEHGRTQ